MVRTEIYKFESIGKKYAEILGDKMGIKYANDFYRYSLEEIVEKTSIEEPRVQQWIDTLDLFRIPKLKIRHAELLYQININSVEELAHRDAVQIYYRIKHLAEETYFIVLKFPSFRQIRKWIFYAHIMSKSNKYGLSIPVIALEEINFDRATDLAYYQVYTVGDLVEKKPYIKRLRRVLKMTEEEYQNFLDFIDILALDEIDIYLAEVLVKAGITNRSLLETMPTEEILARTKKVQDREGVVPFEVFTLEILDQIKEQIKGGEIECFMS